MFDRTHTRDFQYFKDNSPEWMTDEAINTLSKGYLLSDETPNDMYKRLSSAAAGYYPTGLGTISALDLYHDFYKAFTMGWLSPATPVASNFGANDTALPVSCAGLTPDNSIAGIFETAKEAALLTKYGSGLGINISDLVGGSKVVDWAKVYNLVADVVAQGNNQRRGAVALYCDIWHPDIDSFLNARDLLSGDHREKVECNIAVIIDRKFMDLLRAKDNYVVALWSQILKLRMKYGNPYIQFQDNCWDADPDCYKALGMKSGASQLCLAGDTKVVTRQGITPIKDLVGKTVDIFDGENWVSNSKFFSQGESKLLEIELGSGQIIRMTPDHRCPRYDHHSQIKTKNYQIVSANQLKVGDRLVESEDYRYSGEIKLTSAYLKGFLIGDGSSINDRAVLSLYSPKYTCESKLLESSLELKAGEYRTNSIKTLGFSKSTIYQNDRYYGYSERKTMQGLSAFKSELYPFVTRYRHELPSWIVGLTVTSKHEFLSGLFDADGSISNNNLQLSSISEPFIDSLIELLNSLGYAPNKDIIKRTSADRTTEFCFRVSLKAQDSFGLLSQGCCQRLKFDSERNTRLSYRRSTEWTKVVRISEVDNEEVFCTTVTSTGLFTLANGILTGNCSEIFLYTDASHTYSCVLSSLNAAKYEEWKNFQDFSLSGLSLPSLGIVFLDAVNEEFVVRGKEKAGLENSIRSAEKGRSLGLGVLGLHSLYLSKMIAWASEEAKSLNLEIFKFIDVESQKATRLLANELGEPLWCKGFGIRNTHLIAVAPTTTNSLLCNGGSPGIEPIIANYFTMKGAKVTATRQNPYLTELLESKGKNTGSVWVSIREHAGSVQHLSFLSDHEKEVFKTAYEIDQKEIINQAADRQQYIDQGQSLNLFFEPTADAQYISDTHLLADKLGIKSLYYLRSENVLQNANRSSGIEFVWLKTRDDCPYCRMAKSTLDKYQIPYATETKLTGRVPEIWIAGEMLDDGYNTLIKRLEVLPDVTTTEAVCNSCEG